MRFHFHIRIAGQLIHDLEGEDLPDLESARSRAKAAVEQILARPDIYGGTRRWRTAAIVVRDGKGQALFEEPFSANDRPGTHFSDGE